MTALSALRARLAQRLADPGNATWSTDALTEAIRSALEEYNQVAPLARETVITLAGDGHEIPLDLEGLENLLDVFEVWWPYNSLATAEYWPPNQVHGFRLWWDDGRPVLFLSGKTQDPPVAGDELRLWYTVPQTIQDLDSAALTTLPVTHEGPLLTGAAGHAAARQMIGRAGAIRIDQEEAEALRAWGEARLTEYRAWLDTIRARNARAGRPWPERAGGWEIDRWDRRA